MSILHPAVTGTIYASDYAKAHVDTTTPEYYGAKGDGTTDDSAAFQAAIDAVGTAYASAKTYYLATPLLLRKSGDGVVGAGPGLTKLKCAAGAVKVDPAQAATIDNCVLQGFYAYPSATTAHANSQEYADHTAIDLTGVSHSVVRDVHTHQWQTHLKLDYSTYRTYKNYIENVRMWGGETGIYLGGSASPHDGANANKFVGCSIMAMQKMIHLRGGLNSFVGMRLENSSQASGYPLTSIGVQLDSGYYAVYNTFIDTYCELVGTGNQFVYLHDTGAGGTWISPNTFLGGNSSVNGALGQLHSDAATAVAAEFGTTFDLGGGATYTRHLVKTRDGSSLVRSYDDNGGIIVTDYTSGLVTIAHETYGTAAPTTGTWIRGARCWNTQPSAGGVVGWVCVAAGTPGTWKSFGSVEA